MAIPSNSALGGDACPSAPKLGYGANNSPFDPRAGSSGEFLGLSSGRSGLDSTVQSAAPTETSTCEPRVARADATLRALRAVTAEPLEHRP